MVNFCIHSCICLHNCSTDFVNTFKNAAEPFSSYLMFYLDKWLLEQGHNAVIGSRSRDKHHTQRAQHCAKLIYMTIMAGNVKLVIQQCPVDKQLNQLSLRLKILEMGSAKLFSPD